MSDFAPTNTENAYTLQMARQAKAARDEDGVSIPRADRALAYYEAGVFEWPASHDIMSATPAEFIQANGGRPAERHASLEQGDDEFTGRRGGEAASNQYGTFTVHEASPKQIGFLKRLLASKDISRPSDVLGPIKVPADLDNISKKSASALIDRLMGCPDKAGAADPAAPLATESQMRFLNRLIAERDYFSLLPEDRTKVDAVQAGRTPTKRGASALIEVLKATAYATRPAKAQQPGRGDAGVAASTADTLEMGMYRTADGTLYRVYPARQGGHLLAKRLIVETVDDETVARFEYAGAAGRFVKPSERMSLEEAKAFGQQFNVCCVCAALLSDPESVAAGIGPVCGGRV